MRRDTHTEEVLMTMSLWLPPPISRLSDE